MSTLELLAKLSTQRTARTDRLHEATCALLSRLEDHVEIGARVVVCHYELRRVVTQTNVGSVDGWAFRTDEYSCMLDRPVGVAGYYHGDFHAGWTGPSRADLIEFAARAGRFVEAFLERERTIADSLDKADADLAKAGVGL